jgi:hypothetical protein
MSMLELPKTPVEVIHAQSLPKKADISTRRLTQIKDVVVSSQEISCKRVSNLIYSMPK